MLHKTVDSTGKYHTIFRINNFADEGNPRAPFSNNVQICVTSRRLASSSFCVSNGTRIKRSESTAFHRVFCFSTKQRDANLMGTQSHTVLPVAGCCDDRSNHNSHSITSAYQHPRVRLSHFAWKVFRLECIYVMAIGGTRMML